MSRFALRSYPLLLLVVAGLIAIAVTAIIWKLPREGSEMVDQKADPYTNLDLDNPQASYQILRYVCERGGDKHARKFAIDWLAEQARLRLAPKSEQETWMLSVIESGGHPDWDIETQLWLFNDAFNWLHLGEEHEKLTSLLLGLAAEHPNKTMRLYALQHIELQRAAGNLVGPMADEAHATLKELAYGSDSEVAGTALVALAKWEGENVAPSQDLIELALELAVSTDRPIDVRVTAMHAVGDHTLALARTLAPDVTQPVLVRKAAIACIGKYGTDADTAALKELATENFRIAQAADPAIKAIRNRAENPGERTLIQF